MNFQQIILLYIISTIIFISNVLEPKFKRKDSYLFFIFPIIIHFFAQAYSVIYYNISALQLAPLFITIIYLIVIFFAYKDSFSLKLALSSLVLYVISATACLHYCLNHLLPNWIVTIVSIIMFLTYAGFGYYFSFIKRLTFIELKRSLNTSWNIISTFFLFNYLFLHFVIITFGYYETAVVIIFQLCITAFIMIAFNLYTNLILEMNITDSINRQITVQKGYAHHFMTKNEDFRKVKHDFKYHIHTLKALLASDQVNAAIYYIDEIDEIVSTLSAKLHCSNTYANAIFSNYDVMCSEEHIHYTTKTDLKEVPIKNLDLSIILNNSLANAFEACLKVDGSKEISIIAKSSDNFFAYRIANSFNGEIKKDHETFLTTKEDTGHGIGISSIRSIVEKYDGDLTIDYTNNTFILEVLIQI